MEWWVGGSSLNETLDRKVGRLVCGPIQVEEQDSLLLSGDYSRKGPLMVTLREVW